MKLNLINKQKILQEFSDWVKTQYAGKNKEERQKFGQFFTPPELTINMLEKFENLEGNILDPTCGCGGLLAAAIIAGANSRKCYGIELDKKIAKICRDRLSVLGVPRFNIKIGDALKEESYNFLNQYENSNLLYFNIIDLGLSKIKIIFEFNQKIKFDKKEIIIDYTVNEKILKKKFEILYKTFNLINTNNFYLNTENYIKKMKIINAFFKKYLNKEFICKEDHIINFS